MKPDYRNWMPKGMIYAIASLSLVFLALSVAAGVMMRNTCGTVLAIIFAIAFVISAKSTQWCIYAYRAFSYDGERKLSRAVIEGTASYIKLEKGEKALDVGCGSGALAIAAAKRNPDASVVGIDRWGKEYASYSCSLCLRNAEAEGVSNVTFQSGNACHLDFPDESFDAVMSNYVYHNITGKNKQDLLLETLRVLKRGGSFAIHDLMSERRYGDMDAFVKKLYSMGYEKVELVDTTNGLFMFPKEAGHLMLKGSTLLIGKK